MNEFVLTFRTAFNTTFNQYFDLDSTRDLSDQLVEIEETMGLPMIKACEVA